MKALSAAARANLNGSYYLRVSELSAGRSSQATLAADLLGEAGEAGRPTDGRKQAPPRVRLGEVVRLHVENATRSWLLYLRLPGARMKLVGLDDRPVERQKFLEQVPLAPFERVSLDVLFERTGRLELAHRIPGKTIPLIAFEAQGEVGSQSFRTSFETLSYEPDFEAERRRISFDLDRPPDATLDFPTDPAQELIFTAGDRVKLRFRSDPLLRASAHLLVRLEGSRFLILSRDGLPNDNLAWKDALLLRAGEVADLLVEMATPGTSTFHWRSAESEGTCKQYLLHALPVPD